MNNKSSRPIFAVFVSAVLVLSACTSLGTSPSTPTPAATAVHWTYEGEDGPAHWGSLSPDYAACSAGKQQSPINIANAAP
jgi:carbonic anhydrase